MRLRAAVRRVLTQGLAPEPLAMAVVVGLALGVCPVMGTSTLLCAGATVLLDLNPPAVQLANYLAYPLQLGLLVPFIRLGERLFGAPPLSLSVPGLVAGFRAAPGPTLARFWTTLWHAGVAWALVAPAGAALLALALRPAFRMVARRFAGSRGASAG